MRILLIYPEYTYVRKNPPIGIASLAAWMIKRGHDVRIVDMNVSPDKLKRQAACTDAWYPDIVGVSFMTNQYSAALRLIAYCRETWPKSFLICGGPHACALPEAIMQEAPELDAVAAGEGEITLERLVDCLSTSPPFELENVPGLYYRSEKGGTIKSSAPLQFIDFESAPWPAWNLLDLESYRIPSAGGDTSKPTFAILSSRGCPGHCIFCDSHTVFGRRFRGRSAKNIFGEILFLHESYGMERFDFVDDLITFDRDRVYELCRMLMESPKKFIWSANARLDTVDEDMLLTMKGAGCVRVDLGVESGAPEVRKIIKKGISNDRIVRIHKYCKEISMHVSTFLMVGNLGEDMEAVRKTAKLMKGLAPDPSISIACPYPGTELYRTAKENNYLLTEDWSRYSTAPTFLSEYQPVMRTDKMSADEILQAYYYLTSVFIWDKFRSRYGKYFFFNPSFLREYVFSSRQFGGTLKKLGKAFRILSMRLKSSFPGSRRIK